MNFDELLNVTGGFGRYQVQLMLVVILLTLNSAIITMNSVFFAGSADHWCKIPELRALNLTEDQEKNLSIPLENRDGRLQYSQCLRYSVNYSQLAVDNQNDTIWPDQSFRHGNETMPCDQGWVYDTSQYTSTISMEVCGFLRGNNFRSHSHNIANIEASIILFLKAVNMVNHVKCIQCFFTPSIF